MKLSTARKSLASTRLFIAFLVLLVVGGGAKGNGINLIPRVVLHECYHLRQPHPFAREANSGAETDGASRYPGPATKKTTAATIPTRKPNASVS